MLKIEKFFRYYDILVETEGGSSLEFDTYDKMQASATAKGTFHVFLKTEDDAVLTVFETTVVEFTSMVEDGSFAEVEALLEQV